MAPLLINVQLITFGSHPKIAIIPSLIRIMWHEIAWDLFVHIDSRCPVNKLGFFYNGANILVINIPVPIYNSQYSCQRVITWAKPPRISANVSSIEQQGNGSECTKRVWFCKPTQITKFMGPTWGPPWACPPQMDPMLAPWTLLSGQ